MREAKLRDQKLIHFNFDAKLRFAKPIFELHFFTWKFIFLFQIESAVNLSQPNPARSNFGQNRFRPRFFRRFFRIDRNVINDDFDMMSVVNVRRQFDFDFFVKLGTRLMVAHCRVSSRDSKTISSSNMSLQFWRIRSTR